MCAILKDSRAWPTLASLSGVLILHRNIYVCIRHHGRLRFRGAPFEARYQWFNYHSGLSGGFAPNKPPCTLTPRTPFDTSPCTKELYSAFGEKGDEGGEEPDKNTGLRVGSLSMGVEVGFHKGFLDPNTPRTAPGPAYCDKPEKSEVLPRAGAASPSGSSSSRDGSWAVARSASVDLAHNL